jgi:hypothetical protein
LEVGLEGLAVVSPERVYARDPPELDVYTREIVETALLSMEAIA